MSSKLFGNTTPSPERQVTPDDIRAISRYLQVADWADHNVQSAPKPTDALASNAVAGAINYDRFTAPQHKYANENGAQFKSWQAGVINQNVELSDA